MRARVTTMTGATTLATVSTLLLVASALAAVAPAGGGDHAPARVARIERVEIGVEDGAGRWSRPDGTGYSNDVARAAFAAAGVEVQLRVLPYKRCKQLALAGELAACLAMSREPALRGRIVFPANPLFVFSSELLVRADEPRPRGVEELPQGAAVGTVLGYEYPETLLSRLRERGIVLEPSPSESTNLRKVASGRLAAAIVNSDVVKPAAWIAECAGVADRVASAFSVGAVPAYVGFSARHPDGRRLAEQFDAGYREIVRSGELARIQARWTPAPRRAGVVE